MAINRGDHLPDLPKPAEILEPHRKARIRTLLNRLPDDNAEPIVALFQLVYDNAPAVDHETAIAVSRELVSTDKTVGDLIDGWRPKAFGLHA